MNAKLVTLRAAGVPPRAGAHDSSAMKFSATWHVHDQHQLLYAFEGSVEIEDAHARYLVPPQLAAWVPAGVSHCTQIEGRRSGSVFLPPASVRSPGERIRILRVSPLMREMVLEAMRWPIHGPADAAGRAYFKTFALLCREWIENVAPLHLPTTDDPRLKRAMDYTRAHLADARYGDVCRAAGLSERSLRRRFLSLAGMRWTDYRLRCRLFKAMTLLEDETRLVSDVAAAVGFESAGAFSEAFKAFAGESPREFRARIATSTGRAPALP